VDLDFAFLADSADVASSKLYVMGGAFDTIYVQSFPAVHASLAVVIRLLLNPHDLDRKHKLDIVLLDADGRQIASAPSELIVNKTSDLPAGWKQPFTLPMRFFNTPFHAAGHYLIEILMNGTTLKTIPLRVILSPQNLTA
jgi:hypothetical protein